jgi:hypothetical protein
LDFGKEKLMQDHITPAATPSQGPEPGHADFRDYSEATAPPNSPSPATSDGLYGTHVFSFPWNWPTACICRFHVDPVPGKKMMLLSQHYFRLPRPWVCPNCGEKLFWAMRGDRNAAYPAYRFDRETTLEFLATIDQFARMFGPEAGQR